MNTLTIFIAADFIYLAALITLICFFLVKWVEKKRFAHQFIHTGLWAFLLSKTGGDIYFDTRPFVVHHIQPLIHHIADNGFPSDHTTLTMLTALVTYRYNRLGGLLIGLVSILIGLARIHAMLHSWRDITGSVVIAFVSYALALMMERLRNSID